MGVTINRSLGDVRRTTIGETGRGRQAGKTPSMEETAVTLRGAVSKSPHLVQPHAALLWCMKASKLVGFLPVTLWTSLVTTAV